MNRTRIVIILALVAAVIAGVLAAVLLPGENAAELLELGLRCLGELDWESAAAHFEQVLRLDPRNVDAYIGLAEAYSRLGRLEDAERILREGFELTGDVRVETQLGMLRGVLDLEDVLSDDEEAELLARIDEIRTLYGYRLVLITAPEGTEGLEDGFEKLSDEIGGMLFIAYMEDGGSDHNGSYGYSGSRELTIGIQERIGGEISTLLLHGEVYRAFVADLETWGELLLEESSNSMGENAAIVFNDANLEAALREVIERPDGELTYADFEHVTRLELVNKGITDISALAGFENLEWLDLSAWEYDMLYSEDDSYLDRLNAITDFSPLKRLPKLKTLLLNGMELGSLEALSGLANLEMLSLDTCGLTSLSGGETLIKLTTLYAPFNRVSDASPLAKLPWLSYVELSGSPVEDWSVLDHVETVLGSDPNMGWS